MVTHDWVEKTKESLARTDRPFFFLIRLTAPNKVTLFLLRELLAMKITILKSNNNNNNNK
jgi:hypothetical protein